MKRQNAEPKEEQAQTGIVRGHDKVVHDTVGEKSGKYRCNGESVPVEEGREETEAHCQASTGQEE
jgi:hypothetical protein